MTNAITEDWAARIERLEAVDAILRLKHRYGELVDRLAEGANDEDLDALGNLFTEDAFVDFATVQLPGRAAILKLYGGAMQENIAWLWHSFHSPVVEVKGNWASGRWTLQGVTINHNESVPTTVYGRYNDEFVYTDEGWRIAKMTLIPGPAGPLSDLRKA